MHICYSKMDHEESYAELPYYIDTLKNTKKKIESAYPDFNYDYFSTSIYNVYSIVKVFSSVLVNCIDEQSEFKELLKNFAEKYDFEEAILFDNTGLLVASYQHKASDYGNDNVIHSATMDRIISDNLNYFKKVEDEKDANLKFYQHLEGDYINYGYSFPKTKDSNEYYYVSIIVSKNNEKKYDWNTFELQEECMSIFKKIEKD
ncbi:MAG: hypothetical protein GF364_18320 [Candidatus Lokiarchaeota archaeon]|nr:hypothetical protein [Candidatus Lokiarchaeota archaeon]